MPFRTVQFLFPGFQRILCAIQMKGQEAQRSTRQITRVVPCSGVCSELGLGYSNSSRAFLARPALKSCFKACRRKKCLPLARSLQKAPCITAVPPTPLEPRRAGGSIGAGRGGLTLLRGFTPFAFVRGVDTCDIPAMRPFEIC